MSGFSVKPLDAIAHIPMKKHPSKSSLDLQGVAPLLQVYDMLTSLKFYRDMLEFSVDADSGRGDESDWVLLKGHGCQLMLNTVYESHRRPAKRNKTREIGHTDTCLYFHCPDVDATFKYLSKKGLKLEKPNVTGYGWKAIHLTDPDGYHLCFHWPLQESSQLG